MKYKNILIIFFAVTIIASLNIAAQDKKAAIPEETTANVPALEKFHDVIYKLWHTAWPEKDVAMLAELLPEIQKLGEPIIKAELPGILRDKKPQWNEQTKKFQSIIAEYKKSSSPIDSQKLLDAAEQLHAQYEKLVRIVRPALKEIEDFHSTLYMLYHYYLPENNMEKIAASSKELKTKMTLLNKATLSERMKKKEAAFTEARTKLSKSVDALNSVISSNEKKTIKTSIETMHTDYQALEKVFE